MGGDGLFDYFVGGLRGVGDGFHRGFDVVRKGLW